MVKSKFKELRVGKKCQIDPTALIGFEEGGKGRIIIFNNVRIRPYVVLRTCGGAIVIGNNSVLGVHTTIHALGTVIIGDDVLISPNVGIYAQNHGIRINKLISEQENVPGRIEIKNGAWIGANAVIVGPVIVGEGAVIGAGSVVTKDIPSNAIVIGNPAHVLRYRS